MRAGSHRFPFRPLLSHSTALLAGVLLAGLGTAVYAWTGPQNTPPNCVAGQAGCDAPLNAGSGSQVKNGNLSVNTFTATQDSVFYGNLGVGSSDAPDYPLDVTGAIRSSGEIISTNANQFRMISGNYGAFLRNDGANTYLLLTASGDQYGTWNSLRPLYVNDASGVVNSATGLSVSSTTGSAITGTGPSSGSAGYGVFGKGGSYYGALGRADGYSFVGSGTLYNAGTVRSKSGGFMFPDGTVQTTAAKGISSTVQESCTLSGGLIPSCQTSSCPATYFLTGCSGNDAIPSFGGGTSCSCSGGTSGTHCYAYCAK